MAYQDNYFFVLMNVTDPAAKDRFLHAATIMDGDSYWNSNDKTEDHFRKGNGGAYLLSNNPAGDTTKLVVAAWLDGAKDYNAPEFAVFRSGKGDLQGYRASMSQADFDALRVDLVLVVRADEAGVLAANGVIEDIEPLP